jgi:hypothetical protein
LLHLHFPPPGPCRAAAVGHDPAVLVMVAVMGTGFCQTLMASAKPVAIFGQAEGAGFAPADLLRLALPLAPVTAVLVTLFALAVWPRQLAALQDVTMALPLTTKERAAIAALPETPAAPQAMATTPHDQIRGRISPAVPAPRRRSCATCGGLNGRCRAFFPDRSMMVTGGARRNRPRPVAFLLRDLHMQGHPMTPLTVLIAPSGFKESLSVDEVAQAVVEGVQRATGGTRRPVTVTGPVGDPVAAAFGLLGALAAGAGHILVGCGDSGIYDGSADMARVLGVRLLCKEGAELGPGGGELLGLHRIDAAVNWHNALLGPRGVARVSRAA